MVDPNSSDWLQAQQRTTRRTRWTRFAIIIVLAIIIVGVGYALTHKSSKNSELNSSDTNTQNLGSTNGPLSSGQSTNKNSSSSNSSSHISLNTSNQTFLTWDKKPVNLQITPNPAFKKSFYGLNYGPVNATFPWCTNTLGDVIEDIKVLSQLTNRIRLYGMDCNAANQTIMAIKLLNLKMTVIPTIWIDNNMTTYERQYNDLFNNLKEHGFSYIEGISVGNEVVFRKEIPTSDLYARIADVRKKVLAMPGAPQNIPIFTSDIGSNVDQAFVSATDVIFANIHPYFGGVTADQAAQWTFNFFEEFDVAPASKQKKLAVMSEVGWATRGDKDKEAVPSIPNLKIFLDTFICAANKKGYRYYYFESFDTPWKEERFTVLEGAWGLFSPDRVLKPGLTIPDCPPTVPNLRT
ncbi:hypothetical protein G9A89_006613 [Geosiphon pyriformis]|nr:hypothetical protein G9A89_006613 [Geosiphon pyriformis]